ncbi:MAG: hypothetical protein EON84_08645 [Bradyrhizobiaceae bacterium]|nr:MAG: hypothetical protein EON84_08645 [Bradyrhizobiaceae bacterium]
MSLDVLRQFKPKVSWLALAAAPVFAAMAIATMLDARHAPSGLFGPDDGFGIGGMLPMYVLMSIVHLSPWLDRASAGWRGDQAR